MKVEGYVLAETNKKKITETFKLLIQYINTSQQMINALSAARLIHHFTHVLGSFNVTGMVKKNI